MNILITGGKGQLGQSIKDAIPSRSVNNYIFTDVDSLDITDALSVERFVEDKKIDVIVNCAAYTDVEKAEDDYARAEQLNSKAVRILADTMKRCGGYLIHISTDYVFGGESMNRPLKESDPVNPTGVYGLTKLHGEEQVAESGAKALIFRTSWLYSRYGRNFFKTMLELTSSKPELKVVFDQIGTPTNARDLAEAIVRILEEGKLEGNEGIFHYSNEGVCSWFDFATMIGKLSGHTRCKINPCHSEEFPSKVKRPAYSVLDKSKFKERFNIRVPYWIDSLEKTIKSC